MSGDQPVTHPRQPPRRAGGRGSDTWWSRAWQRSVEEAAYSTDDLRRARTIARRGEVGSISVSSGQALAAVMPREEADHGALTATCTVPPLSEADARVLLDLLAAESGRLAALLSGDLPHSFVEAVEEAGVELLPYGGELGAACTCDAWVDPCVHALAVLTQVGWLVQRDPFVLLHLRGLPRDLLLERLHRRGGDALPVQTGLGADPGHTGAGHDGALEEDLAVAEEGAARAARWLAELDPPD